MWILGLRPRSFLFWEYIIGIFVAVHAREVDGMGGLVYKEQRTGSNVHIYKTTKIKDKEEMVTGDKNEIPRRQNRTSDRDETKKP